MALPRWVDAAEGADASESDSEEEMLDDDDHRQDIERAVLERLQSSIAEAGPSSSRAQKISIKLGASAEAVCHVCGKHGHFAGFVNGTYHDCINKPCYLCGATGHSTTTCPHRLAPELGCKAAADVATDSILHHLRKREREGRNAGGHSLAPTPGSWAVDAAVLKLHARRCTCLEFHPTMDNLVLSGDKHGQIAVWDVDKVFERTVYTDLNRWMTNALRFMPEGGTSGSHVATASYDGTVKIVDVEVGVPIKTLVDANPRGWEYVVEEDKAGKWVTFIGLDVMPATRAVVAGDSKGRVYFLDPRCEEPVAVLAAHKKNNKVQSVSVNPVADHLVLTAGNDYQARLLDARCLGDGGAVPSAGSASVAEVASFSHTRVINSAYFSPITGRKILTTSQDNRLRVWDNFAASPGGAPDREIVHSHTFNRHLTPFKAEWDPKDPHERLACIGRYISENFGGVPLHPIDLIDVATGATLGMLADPNLTTICPVNKPHPRREMIVTGSSRSLYAWRPAGDEEDAEKERMASGEMGGNANGIGSVSFGGEGSSTGNTFTLRGSSHYVFFDADGKGGGKKKRAKVAGTENSKLAGKKKGKGKGGKKGKEEEEGDDGSESE